MSDTMEIAGILSQLNLAEKSALSLKEVEEDYVLDVAVQNSGSTEKLLAATSSNHTIRMFNYNDLASIRTVKGHSNVISGVQFGKTEQNLVFTSSFDQTIKSWDTRTDMDKPVQVLEGFDETNNVFTSFDVNSNDRVVCAGTECMKKDADTHVLFWDRRQGSLMGAYSESHQDDITQVCFHPDDPDKLATGSTDGLVCVFDIGESSEDDALQLTLNSESSVARIGWFGDDLKNLYCVTHVDTFQAWDTENDGEDIKILDDLKETLKDQGQVDYLVDCFETNNRLLLTTGTHSGDVRLVDVSCATPTVVTTLSGGHNSTVRVSHWDCKTNTLVTGGEDSILCLWSKDSHHKSQPGKKKLKMKTGSHKKSKPY